MKIFRFTAKFRIDDYSGKEESGFTVGKSYSYAVKRICEYYGEENLIELKSIYEIGPVILDEDAEEFLVTEKNLLS